MQNHHIIFTKEGYEQLKKEKTELLTKRVSTVANLQRAREMGDLSENGFYKAAKFELGNIDRSLRKLEELLRFGKVVQIAQSEVVAIGTTVTIQNEEEVSIYMIVGAYEANPSLGKISYISPLGKALMGKKSGELVTIATPKGVITYAIVKVANI